MAISSWVRARKLNFWIDGDCGVGLRGKKTFQFFGELLKVAGLTFPYDEDFPASLAKIF
jgi:hypothetical protein